MGGGLPRAPAGGVPRCRPASFPAICRPGRWPFPQLSGIDAENSKEVRIMEAGARDPGAFLAAASISASKPGRGTRGGSWRSNLSSPWIPPRCRPAEIALALEGASLEAADTRSRDQVAADRSSRRVCQNVVGAVLTYTAAPLRGSRPRPGVLEQAAASLLAGPGRGVSGEGRRRDLRCGPSPARSFPPSPPRKASP